MSRSISSRRPCGLQATLGRLADQLAAEVTTAHREGPLTGGNRPVSAARAMALSALGASRLTPARQRELPAGLSPTDLAREVVTNKSDDLSTLGFAAWAGAEVAHSFRERDFLVLHDRLLGVQVRDASADDRRSLNYAVAILAAVQADPLANTHEFATRLGERLLGARSADGLFAETLSAGPSVRAASPSTQVAIVLALAELGWLTDDPTMITAASRCVRTLMADGFRSNRTGVNARWWRRHRPVDELDWTETLPHVLLRLADVGGLDLGESVVNRLHVSCLTGGLGDIAGSGRSSMLEKCSAPVAFHGDSAVRRRERAGLILYSWGSPAVSLTSLLCPVETLDHDVTGIGS